VSETTLSTLKKIAVLNILEPVFSIYNDSQVIMTG